MIEELQKELDALAVELDVPGMAVGVVDGDRDIVVTTGIADANSGAPVRPDTVFAIGSTSKTVTGTVAMRLIEEDLFTLDTPVADILPDFRLGDPTALAALRVRHLLTHSGGFLGDADGSSGWGDDALAKSTADYSDLPQLFAPGQLTSYSNSGIRLLGRIVEVTAGAPFETVVREKLFDPLGMSDSLYFAWDLLTRPHAVGHVVADGVATVPRAWPMERGMAPEGGVLSTVEDQVRYARFHLRGEAVNSAPVSDETRLRMQESQIQTSPPLEGIGFPWLIRRQAGARIVEHGGNISNLQLSAFALILELDLAVTTLTNSVGGKEAGSRILAWCLENLRDVRATDMAPVPLAAPSALAGVQGRYDVNQWQWVVDGEGDELVVAGEWRADIAAMGVPPMPTIRGALGEDLVIRTPTGTPLGRFLTTDDGSEFLHLGLRAARRL